MKTLFQKITLILLIALQAYLLYRYYNACHNIDLAFNFWSVAKCDYVSTTNCVEYKDLYIISYGELQFLPLILVIMSLAIGLVIGYIIR